MSHSLHVKDSLQHIIRWTLYQDVFVDASWRSKYFIAHAL